MQKFTNIHTVSYTHLLSIVTRFDMEARPKRSSLQEVVSLIEEDLKKGISYNSQSEIYRYTVDVAKAYLARLYFWSQNWEQAIPVAKEILEAYPLVEGAEYVEMLSAQHARKGNILLRSYMLSHTSGDQNLSLIHICMLTSITCICRKEETRFLTS